MSLIIKQQLPSEVPLPGAGRSTIFVDSSDGQLKIKDAAGSVSVATSSSPAGNSGVGFITQVTNFTDLPATVTSVRWYYVVSDERNKDETTLINKSSLYLLIGNAKAWFPVEFV